MTSQVLDRTWQWFFLNFNRFWRFVRQIEKVTWRIDWNPTVVFILEKNSLTPKSFLFSISETNKHPIGRPPTKIIFMHFERLENWPINPAVAITKCNYCTDLEGNGLCLKGHDNVLLYDFEELERIDKALAPFTSGEDVWLVDSNSGSSSWDVKSLLMSLGVA